MIDGFNAWKNTYLVEAAFDNDEQGPILKNLSDWFVSRSVIVGLIICLAYMALMSVYLYESENSTYKNTLFAILALMFAGTLVYRLIEMKLLYRKLKQTFDTKPDFLFFLSTIAYNRYTQMSNVKVNDVVQDMRRLEKNGLKTIFFFKYFYILTLNRNGTMIDLTTSDVSKDV